MELLSQEQLSQQIYYIRDEKVMLDSDLAKLYQVETRRLMEQVKRNIERFPLDFMFQLSKEEFENLKSQNATSSWGGTRKLSYSFTEQGVYMLATVLKSKVATDVTLNIMRTFTKMRKFALNYEEIIKRLEINENETKENKELILKAFKYLEQILTDTKQTDKNLIGFRPYGDK